MDGGVLPSSGWACCLLPAACCRAGGVLPFRRRVALPSGGVSPSSGGVLPSSGGRDRRIGVLTYPAAWMCRPPAACALLRRRVALLRRRVRAPAACFLLRRRVALLRRRVALRRRRLPASGGVHGLLRRRCCPRLRRRRPPPAAYCPPPAACCPPSAAYCRLPARPFPASALPQAAAAADGEAGNSVGGAGGWSPPRRRHCGQHTNGQQRGEQAFHIRFPPFNSGARKARLRWVSCSY